MTITKSLKYVFTEEEKYKLGNDLAIECAARTDAEIRKKDVDAQLKAEIESHIAKAESLSRKINNGYEYRDIECKERLDMLTKSMLLIRVDNEHVVDTRPLRPEELQTSIEGIK